VLTPEFNVFELSILRVVKVPIFCEGDDEFCVEEAVLLFNAY
jgi:hypothetical protein